MEINNEKIAEKINDEIKKYETLKKSFLTIYNAEGKASKTRKENLDKIKDIKEEDNTQLKELYGEFAEGLKRLEDKRDNHLKKIENLILPVTAYYPEKLKETKKTLADFDKLKKESSSLQKERDKEKDKSAAQDLNGQIANNKKDQVKKAESIEHDLCKFEAERVNDNKYLFLHYVHSELKYHASMVENLSVLFKKIKDIDPRSELPDFIRKYGLKVDLKNIDVNISELIRDKENREMMEQQRRNNVYASEMGNNINNNGSINEQGLGNTYLDGNASANNQAGSNNFQGNPSTNSGYGQ